MTKFKQLTEAEWIKGEYIPMAILPITWDVLEKRLNVKFEQYDDQLGVAKGVFLVTHSGIQFMIEQLLQAPTRDPYTRILGLAVFAGGKLVPMPTEHLDEILEVTGIASTELTWIHEAVSFKEYEVWRQDDHGNKFLVKKLPCRSDARLFAAQLAAGGHKQTYWEQEAK